MTNREMAIRALEEIIETRGQIRLMGIPIDALPKEYNRVIEEAWGAYYKLKGD